MHFSAIPLCLGMTAATLVAASGSHSSSLDAALIPFSDCSNPFSFHGVEYYGATTAGDPQHRPWCTVRQQGHSGPASDRRYVDTSQPLASVPATCQSGWAWHEQTVYGCIRQPQDAGFWCQGQSERIQCSDAVNSRPVQVVPTMAGFVPGTQTTIIASAVGGVLAIALLAGLFIFQRRRAKARANSNKWGSNLIDNHRGSDMVDAYGYGAFTGNGGVPAGNGTERYYNVISTYTPTLGDELEIQPGEKVSVLMEYDDGWCQGINHSRGGLKGVFPRHCIDISE